MREHSSPASRLASLLPASVLLFFAAAFLLPTDPAYALVFYVGVIPPTLVWQWRYGSALLRAPTPPAAFALALIIWSASTLVWGHDDGHRSIHFALDAASTLLFLAAMLAVLPDPLMRIRLADVLVAVGLANATFAIGVSLAGHSRDPRLHGWGATIHPILGASVMATAYATALWRGFSLQRQRFANFAAAAVMGGFILMTESRGPILAGAAVTIFLCAAGPWRRVALACVAGLGASWLLLPASVHHHQAAVLAARGSSHRFEIWQRTFALIEDRPFFGHGLAANVDIPGITFPHDLYLSVLFYSGIVGFALFAALVLACIGRLVRRHDADWIWAGALLVNALVCGLTDLGQITKGPGPMWFIVWLPVSLLAYRSTPGSEPSTFMPTARRDET